MTDITLDQAQEAFETTPKRSTAMQYLETAEQYFDDNMIGPNEFAYVKAKVRIAVLMRDF